MNMSNFKKVVSGHGHHSDSGMLSEYASKSSCPVDTI